MFNNQSQTLVYIHLLNTILNKHADTTSSLDTFYPGFTDCAARRYQVSPPSDLNGQEFT